MNPKILLISLSAAVISFLAAAGLIMAVLRIRHIGNALSRKKRIFLICLIWGALYFLGFIGYFSIYSRCGEKALNALKSDTAVSVSQIERAWYFDGKGTEDVLVFYPGAKVDEKAYAPLCRKLAEDGIDCILVSMPLHMAFTDPSAALRYQEQFAYKNWYLGGHSLGGAMAASYASRGEMKLNGLVLLAAYPTSPLPGMKLCSVYGDQDGVMKAEMYVSGKQFWPENAMELVIPGGNHAQFGDYGLQHGDGTATISAEAQLTQTVDFIETVLAGSTDL